MTSLDDVHARLEELAARRLAGQLTPRQFMAGMFAAFDAMPPALQAHYVERAEARTEFDPPDSAPRVPVILGGTARREGRSDPLPSLPVSRLTPQQMQTLINEAIQVGIAEQLVTPREVSVLAERLLAALPVGQRDQVRAWARDQLAAEADPPAEAEQ